MYNTDAVLNKPKTFVTKQDILDKISMYDLFKKYLGSFKIGKPYNSPLRDDKSPSFGLFISSKDNQILYKDLSTGDCGDAFKLIKQLKGINSNFELYKYIYEDLNLSSAKISLDNKRVPSYKRTTIQVTRKKFTKIDEDYWSMYGISIDTLKFFRVSAISKLFINGILKDNYSDKDPMYAYKVFDKFKIYKPLSNKISKWRGNLSTLDIQGYEQLPEYGDLLIITKSLKDVMVLYEMGYDSISPPSESSDIPNVVMNNIKQRFKRIVVFYDRDQAGIRFARKLVSKYNLDFMFINKKHKTKDISDFVKAHSTAEAKILLSKELKR